MWARWLGRVALVAWVLRRLRPRRSLPSDELLYLIPEGILTLDAQYRVVFFNEGAARITGWTADTAAGQPFETVLRLSASDGARLLSGLGSPRPLHLTTQGPQPVTLAITGARRDDTTVLVLRDITDAETGRNLHSYFLAHISHEFRTPLAGLNASIELLMDEIGHLSPTEIDELLGSIHLSAAGLQALVDNLLESVNIEAGRFTVHQRPANINQVLANAIRMMQPLLDRRRQSLSLSEPLRVPVVQADPTRLTQVVINLLSNASKYSPQAETIDLALSLEAGLLRLAVADRGPGVPAEERENLFSRFVRLAQHDRDQAGMGLGLSVVKAIIEEHHGQVGVSERPGGGSIFWFTLPVEEA